MVRRLYMTTNSHAGYVLHDEDGNQRPAPSGRYVNKKHTIHRTTIRYSRRNGGGWENIFSCTCGWKTKPKEFHHNNQPALDHIDEILASTPDDEFSDKREIADLRRAARGARHALNLIGQRLKSLEKKYKMMLEIAEAKERVRGKRGRHQKTTSV